MACAYLGLGSNLNNPEQQLLQALMALRVIAGLEVLKVSSFYVSKPWGNVRQQPNFINSVTQISVDIDPHQLLAELQRIEIKQHRVRQGQWGPRTLDLDLLLFDQVQIKTAELTVPHIYLKQREFVVYPLYEIEPQLIFPDGESLECVVRRTPLNGLSKLGSH